MIGVALLAAVLFNQPFLRIFDRGPAAGLGGVPLIYIYVFAAWALVILLMMLVVETRVPPAPSAADDEAAATAGVRPPRDANSDAAGG